MSYTVGCSLICFSRLATFYLPDSEPSFNFTLLVVCHLLTSTLLVVCQLASHSLSLTSYLVTWLPSFSRIHSSALYKDMFKSSSYPMEVYEGNLFARFLLSLMMCSLVNDGYMSILVAFFFFSFFHSFLCINPCV